MDPHSRNVAATLSFLSNIYEGLVRRDRDLKLEPALALSWTTTAPDTWRFVLRRNVRFHDGSPFTADDVVFSYERARGPGSLMATSFATVRELRKVDDFTVDIVTNGPDPILPDEISTWLIMSRRWSEQNNAARATDLTRNEQSFASINANGTGWELRVIASTVIGGADLMGGSGTAFGAIIGSALIEIIRNALLMAGVDANWQGAFVGIFIILAVLLERRRARRRD